MSPDRSRSRGPGTGPPSVVVRMAMAVAAIALAGAGLVATPGNGEAAQASPTYYVSLGDSYAVGYQPGLGATFGYSGYVAAKEGLALANFGCEGATTSSTLGSIGCPEGLAARSGAVPYPTSTQAAAAEAFIRAHRGRIGLITVSIGGNDVTSCANATSPTVCVAAAVVRLGADVTRLATGLRAAAGPKVPIIGLTYPDVILGQYVYPSRPATAARIGLAMLSVPAFRLLVNPALKKAYAAAGGSFVDVTTATGAYTPLSRKVTLKPYGTIPVAVASVCQLTWYCVRGNIHANTKGYALIGSLIAARYASVRRA